MALSVHPACVGKAYCSPRPVLLPSVHPHVRGESGKHVGHLVAVYVSPPRAWGKRAERKKIKPPTFGSPPRAWGKRWPAPSRFPPIAVHPHVRGDSFRSAFNRSSSAGSPPRAWGKRRWKMSPGSRRTVHPHVRGESDACCHISRRYIGSPQWGIVIVVHEALPTVVCGCWRTRSWSWRSCPRSAMRMSVKRLRKTR